jgi:hypothetical protein
LSRIETVAEHRNKGQKPAQVLILNYWSNNFPWVSMSKASNGIGPFGGRFIYNWSAPWIMPELKAELNPGAEHLAELNQGLEARSQSDDLDKEE